MKKMVFLVLFTLITFTLFAQYNRTDQMSIRQIMNSGVGFRKNEVINEYNYNNLKFKTFLYSVVTIEESRIRINPTLRSAAVEVSLVVPVGISRQINTYWAMDELQRMIQLFSLALDNEDEYFYRTIDGSEIGVLLNESFIRFSTGSIDFVLVNTGSNAQILNLLKTMYSDLEKAIQ
jgi:hypothetical protein